MKTKTEILIILLAVIAAGLGGELYRTRQQVRQLQALVRRLEQPHVRAEWYGVRGDGIADDTEALQRAIHAVAGMEHGGMVMFDGGISLVTAAPTNH